MAWFVFGFVLVLFNVEAFVVMVGFDGVVVVANWASSVIRGVLSVAIVVAQRRQMGWQWCSTFIVMC